VAQSEEKRRREGSDPVGRCPVCGKLRFYSRQQARRFVRRVLPGELYSFYDCGGFWHFGHLPRSVRNGHLSRAHLWTASQ
jgi:hypothetical protein